MVVVLIVVVTIKFEWVITEGHCNYCPSLIQTKSNNMKNNYIETIKYRLEMLEDVIKHAELDNIIDIDDYNKITSKLEIVGNIIYKL